MNSQTNKMSILKMPLFIFLLLASISEIPAGRQQQIQPPISTTVNNKILHKSKSNNESVDFKSKSPIKSPHEKILPQLLPHEDKCYLVEFHHDKCDFADQMEPVLQRLEYDLDTKIRRINVSRRKEFQTLLQAVGHDECGSFPFYYNRRTGQAVCGPTSYSNLRSWGIGHSFHLFHDPPENINDREARPQKRGELGLKDYISDKFSSSNRKEASKKKDKKNSPSSESASPDSESSKKSVFRTFSKLISKSKGRGPFELKKPPSSPVPSNGSKNPSSAAERTQARRATRDSKKKEQAAVK